MAAHLKRAPRGRLTPPPFGVRKTPFHPSAPGAERRGTRMQVKVEDVSPVEKRLAVEIEWPLVAAKLDEAYRELGRGVTLKGFRKGKVPRNILERMFARQVEQEVVQKLLQESFFRAAQQHAIEPVASPIVDEVEMKKGSAFRYSARVEVRAPLDPKDYDGVPLERPAPVVTDEEITQAVERKREELTEYKKIEGRDTLAASDVIVADVKGELAGKPISRDGMMIDLSGLHQEGVPGLGAALCGAPVAAKDHPVTLMLPADPEAPGEVREARLTITIRDAREKQTPALDDDFAKDTGDADTLLELRGKLRLQLLAQKEREGKDELRAALIKEILRRNEFPVASALVDRQIEATLERMAQGGFDMRKHMDEARLKDELRGSATDQVRAGFLISAIAEKEKVEVSDADLEKRLAEMAKQQEKSVSRLKAELQKEGRFEPLKHHLREEKTLDLLLTRANITPKPEADSPSEK
ncbi:MAG: trigger factor [Myxococcales bacterium]|nr:trigger factor [Myxococcales bacterium]